MLGRLPCAMSRYTYAPGLLIDDEIKATTELVEKAIHAEA